MMENKCYCGQYLGTTHNVICKYSGEVYQSHCSNRIIDSALYNIKKGIHSIDDICDQIHILNNKWWIDLETEKPIERNVGEMLMLVVSEIAEAMEGHRKNLMDDKLPNRTMIEVELADAVIRIFDIASGLKLDLGGALFDKCVFNTIRVDHSIEHRKSENGKKY